MHEYHTQMPQKNQHMGIMRNTNIGSYSFEQNLTEALFVNSWFNPIYLKSNVDINSS